MTRTLPCCGCACSATRLLGCHPSRCSPPLFHSHVRVNSVLAARTACLASRVACVRAWSWLSHPRPPDRSQDGCTVGVDRDPPVCSRCPGSMASVAERQLVLCWSVCCGARTRSVYYAVSTFCTVFSHRERERKREKKREKERKNKERKRQRQRLDASVRAKASNHEPTSQPNRS